MGKHTPGPWEFMPERRTGSKRPLARPMALVLTTRRGGLAIDATDSGKDYEEDCANARLIAAAPDLLAALERIADEMQSASSANVTVDAAWLDKRINVARAAIAKTEGRGK